MAWNEPPPSSHAGAVTRGSCLPATPRVKVTPISLVSLLLIMQKNFLYIRYERGQLLICEITLNGPVPCLPSSMVARLIGGWGSILYFLDTLSSGSCFRPFIWGALAVPRYNSTGEHTPGQREAKTREVPHCGCDSLGVALRFLFWAWFRVCLPSL